MKLSIHPLQKRLQKTHFVTSAATASQCPSPEGLELAFVGRSNVGKSSVLNSICHQNHLAKTSRTPGRTQLINFFKTDDELQLVDLPGYGFAKVSRFQQQKWQAEVTHFLETRESLKGLILIMDIRHPLKDTDKMLLQFAQNISLPVHMVLNKADKLSRQQGRNALATFKRQAIVEYPDTSLQVFSAQDRVGLDDFYKHLSNNWEI